MEKKGLLLTGPGICACGCGQPTKVATRSNTKKGHVKGQPLEYVYGHHKPSALLAKQRSRRTRRWIAA